MSLFVLALLAACNGDAPGDDTAQICVSDDAFFEASMVPLLADCAGCHVADGVASGTRNELLPLDDPDALATNRATLRAFVNDTPDGAQLLLDKPTGRVSHGGGRRFDAIDPPYAVLHEFVARTQAPGSCAHPGTPPPTCDPGTLAGAPAGPRRLTDRQIRNAVFDLFGVDPGPNVFPPTVRGPDFRTFATANPVTAPDAEQLMLAAETVAAAVDVDAMLACGPTPDCARQTVLAKAERAYRRPLTTREAEIATRFIDAGLDPIDATQLSILLLLQSPQFLYVDAVPEGEGLLDDYAIAARLALFLTDTLPDDELWAAAEAGEVHTREQVAEHATRLVQDPRALRAVTAFHEDWLDGYRLDEAERDPDRYPGFSEATRESLRTEMDLLVAEVVWGGSGRFDDLMFTTTSWVDSELAAIYGVPDPGPGWHRVELGDDRPGALTRAGFLTGHAYAATSSPVKRGAFVLQELLCEELIPPQDVNMELPPEGPEALTIRDRLAVHAADPVCAGCHVRMDPLGYAFENFDAIGAHREFWESGIPVDATGGLDDPAGDFDGAAEMLALVATSAKARQCYARRWYEYGQGRPVEDADNCSLDMVQQRFEASGGDIRALMVDVAITDAFRAQIPSPPPVDEEGGE